jgi:uncharacterized membrane protein YcaP (DUF421 family)
MDKADIHFGDWARMFVGDVPGVFYIELIVRTVFVYLLLVFAMRLLGKRMSAQASRNELAALVTLAAAIGIPLQDPARGLLPAIIIATIVVVTGSAIAKKAYYDPEFERFSQGDLDILVEDGKIMIDTLRKIRMSNNRMFASLREKGIRHLGEVKRLYMEAGGTFTLVKEEKPVAGLCIIPDWDTAFVQKQKKSKDTLVCRSCGNRKNEQMLTECNNCKNSEWVNAIE